MQSHNTNSPPLTLPISDTIEKDTQFANTLRQAVLTPQLHSGPRLADGQFTASFSAIPGRAYTVEASTNLVDWLPWATTIATDFNVDLELASVSTDPMRFFRITTR